MNAHPPKSASIGHGTVWSILNNGLSQFLVLAVFLVTARFVSQESFGVMAICFITLELFRQIAIESITTALIAKNSPQKEDYNACFLINICISVIAAALLYFLAAYIADFLNNQNITGALEATSLLILTAGLSRTHEAWLTRHLAFKVLALRSLFSIIAGGAVGITLAVKGYGLTSLIAQQLVTSIIGTVFLWGSTIWRPTFETSFSKVYELLHASRHIALTGIANFASGQTDVFFSAYYLGATATGIYNAAKRIIIALNAIIATALGKVALPVFAGIQTDQKRLQNYFLIAVGYTTFITAPAYVGIAALAPELIVILLGDTWIDAAPVLSILVIGSYFTTIGQYNQSIFLVKGKSQWQTYIATFYAVINVLLFFIFARYGLAALAFAFTCRTILLYPVSAKGALYLLNIPTKSYLKCILPSIGASIVMGISVRLISDVLLLPAFLKVIFLVPCGIIIYGAIMWLIDKPRVIGSMGTLRKMFTSSHNP